MSSARRLICLLSTCVAVGPVVGVRAQSPPPQQPAPGRVVLHFDEQLMTDQLRAQLYGVIAQSVPESQWPTLRLSQRTSLPALLNEHFDIYASGRGAAPRTQKVLSDMILAANQGAIDPAGGVLTESIRLPPVPVRAHSYYEKSDIASRRFDPNGMSYELMSATGESKQVTNEPLAVVEKGDARQVGKTTAVVLSLTPSVRDWLQKYQESFRSVVAVDDSDDGVATMTLLTDEEAPCDSAGKWMAGSPYESSMRMALTAAEVAKIESGAANLPFTIIDWNVGVPNGHGAKVRAVVSEVLRSLGLSAIDKHVKTFELNPVRNRQGLKDVLARYKAQVLKEIGQDNAKLFEPAEKWVEKHVPGDETSINQRVPSLVLQAVFWTHFQRPQALNFSFTTDSAALTVLDAKFMVGARAFGALAAGNTGMPASPALKPQSEAYRWRNVVNVTHGRPDGAIDGDITNEQFKVIVNLIAPGCGYTTSPLVPADIGSSFASPYVGTVAWIRMLQGVPAGDLKRLLINASQPVPAVGRRVESGGLFDPALFLLRPTSHIVTAAGAFLTISSLKFEMTYEFQGAAISIKSDKLDDPAHVVTFHRCGSSTELCTTVRKWLDNGDLWMTTGQVRTFTFEATAGQQKIQVSTADGLLQLVRLITF